MSGRKHWMSVAIREWSEDDLGLLQRLMGDPEMMRYLGGPESPDQISQRHQRYVAIGGTGTGHLFVILAGPERTPAGSVGFWERPTDNETVWETGWSVLPAFQGQGIATHGTALAIEQARDEKKHRYLHAYPTVDNLPSNAICRKLGFTLVDVSEYEYPPGNLIRCNDWRLDLRE